MATQPPRARLVPPALVVLGVLGYAVAGPWTSDGVGPKLIFAFVVLPGAFAFLCGYAVAYLVLRRMQRGGGFPRSGATVVSLSALVAVACVAAIVSLFVATGSDGGPPRTTVAAPAETSE